MALSPAEKAQRADFLKKHPEFAQTSGADRERFLRNHPTIALQWTQVSQHDNGGDERNGGPIDGIWPGQQGTPQTPAPTPAAGGGGTPTPAAPTGYDALSEHDKDWVDELTTLFKTHGLESLATTLTGFVQEGYTGSALTLHLRESEPYKQRFAGNASRGTPGKPVLSEREYLAAEEGYAQAMSAAGMPAGFYDDPTDFASLIGRDVSPAEMNSRMQGYVRVAAHTDPATRKLIQDQFGIALTDGDIAAWMLDPTRMAPLIEKTVNAIGISSAAQRQGLSSSAARSLALTEAGVSEETANSQMGNVAVLAHDFGRAAQGLGTSYDQTAAEDEKLLGLESAKRKREQLENAFNAVTATQTSKVLQKRDSSSAY